MSRMMMYEQDDELWEKKKNGTLTTSEITASQKKVTQARKVDVDEAKQEYIDLVKDYFGSLDDC